MPYAPAHGRARPAFSLIELTLSLSVLAILGLGIAAAIMIAARALPSDRSPTVGARDGSAAARRLAEELALSAYVTERTANAVTFVLADRDGDGSPEVVRYAWSGTAGDPLRRSYNGSPEAAILDDVQAFRIEYDVDRVTETYPGPLEESAEQELASHTEAISVNALNIGESEWHAQVFRPALSAAVASWSVTRVVFSASASGQIEGQTMVQLRRADRAGRPTEMILAEELLDEAALGAVFDWTEIAFPNASGFGVNDDLCLVFKGVLGDSARIESALTGTGLLTSFDGGVSWSSATSQSARYSVFGRVRARGPNQSVTREHVTGAHLTVRAGVADETVTATSLLNRPETLSAYWEADFSVDPTTIDVAGDGADDWLVRNGVFDPSTLVNGVWLADATLDSQPVNDFTGITTIDVRMRNTSLGGNGATFWITYDHSATQYAVVSAYLMLQPDGTQTLVVSRKTSATVQVPIVTVFGLSATDFVDLRLLLDTNLGTVNVNVNGEDHGTHRNPPFPDTNVEPVATLLPWGSNAEFDSVRIRVGGQSP